MMPRLWLVRDDPKQVVIYMGICRLATIDRSPIARIVGDII